MATKAKSETCRVCGKKRKLNEEGMCGKCWEESGALPEGEEDACDTPPPDVMQQIQAAVEREPIASGTASIEETIFGPLLGYPEIPKNIAVKFHKKLPKDEYTPQTPELLAVATTPEAKNQMMIEANNGRRMLRVVTKEAKGATYYGVYAS